MILVIDCPQEIVHHLSEMGHDVIEDRKELLLEYQEYCIENPCEDAPGPHGVERVDHRRLSKCGIFQMAPSRPVQAEEHWP